MEIIYRDEALCVVIKPEGVLSTDEAGGVPELLRQQLGAAAQSVRTVHRLDRVVGGLMALACTAEAAGEMSRGIREGRFEKSYLAAVHGDTSDVGRLEDLMLRDRARRMSFIVDSPGKGVQPAALEYVTLGRADGLSLVKICLITGRTHQIRCQFAAHGHPLYGDRKYGTLTDGDAGIALWSHELSFPHPVTGEMLHFSALPPEKAPYTLFANIL